jgi:signal-transduction protein with cAMP-binding, CBS, and nucleotidyltransferase domain
MGGVYHRKKVGFVTLSGNFSNRIGKDLTPFVGILTDTDIVRKGVTESNDFTSMTEGNIMTTPFVTIESHQSPGVAQEMMSNEGVRHLVVREGKTITGVVSIRDLLVFYKQRAEPTYSEPRIGID